MVVGRNSSCGREELIRLMGGNHPVGERGTNPMGVRNSFGGRKELIQWEGRSNPVEGRNSSGSMENSSSRIENLI